MKVVVGLENDPRGRSTAWALEHPGCFAYGATGEAALQAVPEAVRAYLSWQAAHSNQPLEQPPDIEILLDETFRLYTIDEAFELAEDGYTVEAFFRHDWKPLTREEIERGLRILDWSRQDLLETVRGLSRAELETSFPGERWDIDGVLRHVAGAEWWYLDRLNLAFPREELPKETFERLAMVRAHLVKRLPEMEGSRQVSGVDGEVWSPRKVLRRAAWHERDHVEHIRKLVRSLPGR